jgi:hypothetical protein
MDHPRLFSFVLFRKEPLINPFTPLRGPPRGGINYVHGTINLYDLFFLKLGPRKTLRVFRGAGVSRRTRAQIIDPAPALKSRAKTQIFWFETGTL